MGKIISMLLLDRNNEPENTVYYLSAVARQLITERPGLDVSSLYRTIETEILFCEFNFAFLVLALDFLFLLDMVEVDEKGELYVH